MNTGSAITTNRESPSVENAINLFTGVRNGPSGKKVFVYGTPKWLQAGSIDWLLFTPYGKLRPKRITMVRDGINMYRDGGSTEFLIEMPEAYATIYDIESYVLSQADLDRLKTRIDTSRPW